MYLRAKIFLLFVLLLSSVSGWAFTKGYNQAWLKNSFGSQWLDHAYDPKYVEEMMLLNKEGGSEILRMWLYEGSGLSQFNYNETNGTIKLKPELLKNLTSFLRTARKYKLKVNLTFLDGNAFKKLDSQPSLKNFWWNVFNNKYGKLEHFYLEAIAPIYQLVNTEFQDVVTQIDLVNEVNALIHFKMFEKQKASLSSFLCTLGNQRPTHITASLGWAGAEEQFFKGLLNKSCLDFYDIHLYNDSGSVKRCEDFKRFSKKGYTFQLGEFGQLSKAYDDQLQELVTAKFLKNAMDCGFKSALAWRFDDTRSAHNPEARHSYMSFGTPRKAYYIFRDFIR